MKIIRYFMQNVPEAGEKAFKRFYLPLTMSITATLFSIFLIYNDKFDSGRLYTVENMTMVLFAGIPLMTFVFLITEKFGITGKKKCSIALSVLAVMIAYYFTLPEKFTTIDNIRYAVLVFFSVLTFLSVPFFLKTDNETTRKIWLFIFVKTAFAQIAGLCVFAGLSLAILAIKTLFFPLWHDSYRLVSSFSALGFGLISPWIILGSLPILKELPEVKIVEKPFSLISKFVLIPIVLFYLIILYIYFGKVLLFSELPKGMTSYLILSFCGAGILTYTLILEEAKKAVKSISGMFVKIFFFSITGLILLLWYAVWLRIDNYGITENRYLLIIFSLLLTIWTAYFIISKKKNVIFIMITAAVAAFLISFGPWGMFETSFRSQKRGIMNILQKNDLIENGKIIKSTKELPFEERKELSSALFFIESRWGLNRLSEILPPEDQFKNLKPGKGRFYRDYSNNSDTSKVLNWMNIKYVHEWERKDTGANFNFYKNYHDTYTVEGPFDAATSLTCPSYRNPGEKERPFKETLYKAELSKDCKILSFFFNKEKIHEIDMLKAVEELTKKHKNNPSNLSIEELTYKESSEKVEATIIFSNLSGNIKDEKPEKINNIAAEVYFSLKK